MKITLYNGPAIPVLNSYTMTKDLSQVAFAIHTALSDIAGPVYNQSQKEFSIALYKFLTGKFGVDIYKATHEITPTYILHLSSNETLQLLEHPELSTSKICQLLIEVTDRPNPRYNLVIQSPIFANKPIILSTIWVNDEPALKAYYSYEAVLFVYAIRHDEGFTGFNNYLANIKQFILNNWPEEIV